ncbi:MAG TPA: nucleoside diphosphate kinase regulator [Methylophaga sp.]|jgi:regulator of nucleoside diphosphate kinase|nr:nucleoside diphosphate kinase regulator [Methylophaga sp.]MBN15608.1 nucleoside diphosphate kinase regulator [Pelagibacterium sp.]MBP24441.1 nucleoside diphosphate kinase regulator [Methylophaga sp.]HCC81827.1 nucleoside diphosphate kinase regulator [Methylophaga sp.]|tara:strand:+ start:1901 stop:2326 length:426 start_codon:yes stop_codon:yes gene_type:complete
MEFIVNSQPDIIISELDYSRIDNLLRATPGIATNIKSALLTELERAELVAPEQIPANVVTMNSQVKFSVISTGVTFTLKLVYPKDMDDSGNTISILAPVGSAMLGLKEGDEIDWQDGQGGMLQVRIETIEYQPERAGEYHR